MLMRNCGAQNSSSNYVQGKEESDSKVMQKGESTLSAINSGLSDKGACPSFHLGRLDRWCEHVMTTSNIGKRSVGGEGVG